VDDPNVLQLGQIVKVLRGREEGTYAVVVEIIDQKFVMIADGSNRKFDRPKKKNISHLESQHTISREVASSLLESGRVTNGKLRYAMKQFEVQQSEAQEKGE
jgi:ribosomal protein L14E/L6E/L27E